MVNPVIQPTMVAQAKTMMTAESTAVKAMMPLLTTVNSFGSAIKAIGQLFAFVKSQVAFNLGFKNTTYGIAYIKDTAPAAIRKQIEKVVQVAANDSLCLKHAANQEGHRIETQGTRKALRSFKNEVNDLTAKAHELAKASGKPNNGNSALVIGQALAEMFSEAAQAAQVTVDKDYADAITQHYVLNRSLKASNMQFASQPISNMTKQSFTDYLKSCKTAFSGIFTNYSVIIKLIKALVPKLNEMMAHRDSYDIHLDVGQARIVAETADRAAPFQRTVDESVARVRALRGPTGFDGLINEAHIAHLNALKTAIRVVGNANAMIDHGAGLAETIINEVDAIDVSLPASLDRLRAIYTQVIRMSPNQNLDNFIARFTELTDGGQEVMGAIHAYRKAAQQFDELKAEQVRLGGATFNPEVDFVEADGVRTYTVVADSIIATAQTAIPSIRPAVEAEVASDYAFWAMLTQKVETAQNNVALLKHVKDIEVTHFTDALVEGL